MALCKTVIRAGVVTAVVGGIAVAVAGPDSVRAFFHQARANVRKAIDSQVSDPVALRAQLRDLEAQYPKKIDDVRGDLAELEVQIAQLQRDQEVSKKVVEMTAADLDVMHGVLAQAEQTRDSGAGQVVKVKFEANERPVTIDEAYGKVTRLSQLKDVHAARMGEIDRDLGYLTTQRDRLQGLLEQLENERAEFQTQLWSLDRQVDAISRNDRMIDIMQKRQESIEEHSRYRAASLDQVQARLADIRAKQESKLDTLAKSTELKNYENAAKYMIDAEHSKNGAWMPKAAPKKSTTTPAVIEIGPDSVKQAPKPEASSPQVVSR
jgi:predicted RNase H-like nuclease (RuvC/YqgF family)